MIRASKGVHFVGRPGHGYAHEMCMIHRTHLVSHEHQVLIRAELDQLLQVLLGQTLPSWVARVDEYKPAHLHRSSSSKHTLLVANLLVAVGKSCHTSYQHLLPSVMGLQGCWRGPSAQQQGI